LILGGALVLLALLFAAPPPDGAEVVEGALSGYVVVPVELALLEFGALVLLLSLPQAAQNRATVNRTKIARILRIDFPRQVRF
jgi:hypothetical protein